MAEFVLVTSSAKEEKIKKIEQALMGHICPGRLPLEILTSRKHNKLAVKVLQSALLSPSNNKHNHVITTCTAVADC